MSSITLNLESDTVELSRPQFTPATLEQALKSRHSTREFRTDALDLETLSTLLWAGFGINRAVSGQRTAPSTRDWQEIDVYAVLQQGAYRYDARAHHLDLVNAGDLRAVTGSQDFVALVPLNLVYVTDYDRMVGSREEERPFFSGADAGAIAQSVSLYCASIGLGTVVRGLIDRKRLAEALRLGPRQRIALAQSVGYPQRAA